MGFIGSQIGSIAGGALGKKYGGSTGEQIGKIAGGALGLAFPYFKEGGQVKKTGLAYVHKNEFVLPAGVKPTKAQKKAVAKLHKKK